MMRLSAFAALAALMLSACATPPAPLPDNPRVLTLERTRCFGFCPDYTVAITETGAVTYTGRAFVGVTGTRTAQADPAATARLFTLAERANLPSLQREYRAHITDIPSFTVTIVDDGTRASVLDYGGTSVGMPQIVRQLEDEIDRVAGTRRWTARTEVGPATK